MWLRIQIAAYASLVLGYALLWFLALRDRNGRGRAQFLLESSLVLAALWTLLLGITTIVVPSGWWAFAGLRMIQIGLVILALVTTEFVDAFVQRASRRGVRLGMVMLLSLAGAVLDALPTRLLANTQLAEGRTELAGLLWTFAWLSASGAAWWMCVSAYRRATGSKHRNRVRYLFLTVLSFTAGDALILTGGSANVYVGLVARLFGLAVAAISVLRYDLPDIRRLTLTSVRWALVYAVTVLFYLLVASVAGYASGWLGEVMRLATKAWLIWLAWLAAIALDITLRPHFRRWLDGILLGRVYDVQRALRAFSRQVSLILDLERLADTTLEWVRATMKVRRAAFIMFTPQAEGRVELRVLRAANAAQPAPKVFAADNRFIMHFRSFGRPLNQYDVDMLTWFQTMAGEERQWLQSLSLDLYVPVAVVDEPVALLGLGPKADGQPYSEEDIEALLTLAGQVGAGVENARLVTDLRALQEDLHILSSELAETNRQLKRLDQTKADFITIASHELRTPLAQIYGYSDILASMAGDEISDAQAVHNFIRGIRGGASRLKQVVDAMVDVSLLETGAMKLQVAPLKLSHVVDRAVSTIGPAAEQRRQTITSKDLSSLPDVEADDHRIGQVLAGLLSNAVKFTPDGGEITISGHSGLSSSGEAYVELVVEDTGIGVDPDQQPLVFEKFYRAEEPSLHSTDGVNFKGAGPGLGLAIARGIIKAHGGWIWAESSGRDEDACPGSAFHIRLPTKSLVEGGTRVQALR